MEKLERSCRSESGRMHTADETSSSRAMVKMERLRAGAWSPRSFRRYGTKTVARRGTQVETLIKSEQSRCGRLQVLSGGRHRLLEQMLVAGE